MLVCLAVLIAACGRQEQIGEGDSVVYCLNEDGTGLVKVSCDCRMAKYRRKPRRSWKN